MVTKQYKHKVILKSAKVTHKNAGKARERIKRKQKYKNGKHKS
jgi:hypothetical protein